jgi:hypothetical protein
MAETMYETRTRFTTRTTPQRSLFIDLIGPRSEVLERLTALNDQLERAVAHPRVLVPVATPVPFRLADERTVADRVAELSGAPVPYAMAQLEPGFVAAETIRAAQGIARFYEEIELGPSRAKIGARASLSWDAAGRISECVEYPTLVGCNVLLALACFLEQDFGTVVRRAQSLVYICECSEFEKTPKQVDSGANGFLGTDFLEWHRRIPGYGLLLASIFARADELFSKDQLDMLVVDLRGRHLYTDGKLIVRRYERDYAVPLRDASGAYVGLNVFADVLVGDINELRHPLAGGPHLHIVSPITFNRSFGVIRHAAFAEHPIGMRNPDGTAKRREDGAVASEAAG